ncbi:unnamed protein product [Brachionus calyciflorus]|uniref:Uncharacterized protein n=1 Tax=Brachionus calyciflorus TaxID=104777 RepID=A0A814AS93_9BILA|nr:unnamed protein product [Brachionus calyciflorus]
MHKFCIFNILLLFKINAFENSEAGKCVIVNRSIDRILCANDWVSRYLLFSSSLYSYELGPLIAKSFKWYHDYSNCHWIFEPSEKVDSAYYIKNFKKNEYLVADTLFGIDLLFCTQQKEAKLRSVRNKNQLDESYMWLLKKRSKYSSMIYNFKFEKGFFIEQRKLKKRTEYLYYLECEKNAPTQSWAIICEQNGKLNYTTRKDL